MKAEKEREGATGRGSGREKVSVSLERDAHFTKFNKTVHHEQNISLRRGGWKWGDCAPAKDKLGWTVLLHEHGKKKKKQKMHTFAKTALRAGVSTQLEGTGATDRPRTSRGPDPQKNVRSGLGGGYRKKKWILFKTKWRALQRDAFEKNEICYSNRELSLFLARSWRTHTSNKMKLISILSQYKLFQAKTNDSNKHQGFNNCCPPILAIPAFPSLNQLEGLGLEFRELLFIWNALDLIEPGAIGRM